jgi:hypothetical protein
MTTRLALPEEAAPQLERFRMRAPRTAIAIWPPRLDKVGAASVLVDELLLKLPQGLRERRPGHGPPHYRWGSSESSG